MGQVISIGKQDYVSLRENHYFYIDKRISSGSGGKMQMILPLLPVRGDLEKH